MMDSLDFAYRHAISLNVHGIIARPLIERKAVRLVALLAQRRLSLIAGGNFMMRRFACAFAVIASAFLVLAPKSMGAGAKPMAIYFVDVEGGQATLFVSPSGESMLVDTGWPGFNGRDAERIVAAAKDAGIAQIDYVVITHYHRDHVGGVTQLASRIKIGEFVDHGPNLEDSDVTREDYATYLKVTASTKRLTVKPGDVIPIKGLTVQVLAGAGQTIRAPLPGAGQPNSVCAAEPKPPEDATENARSLGLLITYGKFRVVDLGDLIKEKELQLVCPNNLIGTEDLFVVSHHGFDQSNSKSLVDAIHPRVAIMDNGARKGGSPAAWQIVHDSPGLVDLWQLHYSIEGGEDHNVSDSLIANPDENCQGKYIKVTAEADGTFTVMNSRNNYEKTYKK
jgi:beta-lactamase superfamily II metal-dependent hydrolase